MSSLALNTVTIGAGATGAEMTLEKGTEIANMFVYAAGAKLSVANGAVVQSINVTGKDVEISGSGRVDYVTAAVTAENLKVTVANASVANAGAAKVTAAGIEVPSNKVYVIDATGKDVIRNLDGTPDGDGNVNTGANQ